MTNNAIQRALDKQAKLEAMIQKARDAEELPYLVEQLFDQAALARAVIEAYSGVVDNWGCRILQLEQFNALLKDLDKVTRALAAWADHVNGESP